MIEDDTASLFETSATPDAACSHVLVLAPDAPAKHVPLPARGELVFGRGEQADVRIADTAMSRAHAKLVIDGANVKLVDLGSHNGALVNGARVSRERVLMSRDVITLGRASVVYYAAPTAFGLPPLPQHRGRTLVVEDPQMIALYRRVQQLASLPVAVSIAGETGTGKDVVASALHAWSPRATEPFVALNCAAIPDALAESELFGHERGAFSGAHTAKPGVLEQASRGTLFLDEIAEMSLANQSRLLRAIETQRITRLGATRDREIDFRLVIATNKDLEAEVRAERFRADLFFRLGGASVTVPPLRNRVAELPQLAQSFLIDAAARANRPSRYIASDALAALVRHPWPGNVRELRHTMELLAMTDGPAEITIAELPERIVHNAAATPHVYDAQRALERDRMAQALVETGGNQTRAAALIGMPRRTFVEKLRLYNLRR